MSRRALHLLGNLAGLVSGLVTAPLTARALGPDGRGEVAIVVVVSTVLLTAAAIGLPWLARTELAHDPDSLSFWRRHAARVGIALVPVAAAIAVSVSLVLGFDPAEVAAVVVLLVLGVFAAARGVEANALISRGLVDRFGAANVAAAGFTVAVIVAAFVSGSLTVAVVLWTSAASIAVQVGLTVLFVRRATRGRSGRFASRADELAAQPDHRGRALVARAGRAWASQVGEATATRGDTAAVAVLSSSASVGLYSVVALIPQAAYAVYTTVVQASYSKPRSGDDQERFVHVVHACVALSLVLAVLAAPVAWWALPVVFGEPFVASREYLPGALAMTVGLGAFAPVVQRLSAGRSRVLPLAGILAVAAAAAGAGGALAGPAVAVLAVGAALVAGSAVYAIVVTRGAVLTVRPRRSREWWRGAEADG